MMGCKQSVAVDELRGTVTVNNLETSDEPPKTFNFNTVFGPCSKQTDVYNITARNLVQSVLEGYNGKNKAFRGKLAEIQAEIVQLRKALEANLDTEEEEEEREKPQAELEKREKHLFEAQIAVLALWCEWLRR